MPAKPAGVRRMICLIRASKAGSPHNSPCCYNREGTCLFRLEHGQKFACGSMAFLASKFARFDAYVLTAAFKNKTLRFAVPRERVALFLSP